MRFRRTTGDASTLVAAVGLYRCCCCCSGVGSLGTDLSGCVVGVVDARLVLELGDYELEVEAEVDEGDEEMRSLIFVIFIVIFIVVVAVICVS